MLVDWIIIHDDVEILKLFMLIQNIKRTSDEVEVVAVTVHVVLIALEVGALDVPGDFQFFEGSSYNGLALIMTI